MNGKVAAGICLLTMAGGVMDAWVYLAHGHLFANAQTGNVVLLAVVAATGRLDEAVHYVPSIATFIAGLLLSWLAGARLKARDLNSRNVRLCAECVALLVLAILASRLPNGVVTACVGFITAVQITSLSRVGGISFNTGMTTGNLRGATSATVAAWLDPSSVSDRDKVVTLWSMCVAFAARALLGGACASRFGDQTVFVAAAVMRRAPDPLPAPSSA